MPLESFQFALNLPLEAVPLADERKKREMKRTQITFKKYISNKFVLKEY